MHRGRLAALIFSFVVVSAPAAFGAGSGNLWFRYTCADAAPPQIFIAEAGPLTLDVLANALRGPGSLDLSLIDSGGSTVFSRHFDVPQGPSTETITTPPLAAGTYFLKPVGSFYAFFRFVTSATHFVWPPCTDFNGDSSNGIGAAGTYYFYVPAGTTSFTFRLEVPDVREHGTATIFAPDGTARASLDVIGGALKSVSIPVGSPSDAGFWRVDLTNEIADIRFYLEGVPPYFAESPDTWFEPPSGSEKPKTYLTLTVLPASQNLTASAPPQTSAQSYKLTAFVVPTDVTGVITFRADGQAIGTSVLVDGQASIFTTFMTGGTHEIAAEFAGDGLWAASSVTVTVDLPASHDVESVPLMPEAIVLLALGLAVSAAWVLRRA